MIIFHTFGDAGLSPCSPRFKQMPIPLGLAIAGIASSALGTGANVLMQKRANEQNIQNQNSLYQKQKEYQNFLNANSMLIQKQAMQRAGFNPNAQFGTSANLQTPTPSKSDIVAPHIDTGGLNGMFQQMMQLEQQQSLIDAQVRKTDAERDEVLSRIPKNKADTDKTIQETANLAQQHGLLEFENQTQKQKFDVFMQRQFADIDKIEAETSNINIDTKVKDLEAQLDEATLEDRKKIYTQTLYEIISRKDLNYALRKQAFANANKAYIDASFTKAQEHRLRKLLEVEWHKLDQEGKKLGFDMDFVIAQTASIVTKQDWIDFENEMKAFGVGADVLAKILKFTPLGRGH